MPFDPGWDEEAENWVLWARTPGHDAYWYYRDGFFEEVVPPRSALKVEVGCGEGRVSRDRRARGHPTISIDLSPTLLGHASQVEPDDAFLRADAVSLPLASGCCEVVVAYNSLTDVWDMERTVAEAARVLRPGGSLCVRVPHPVREAGLLDTDGEAPGRSGRPAYFGRRAFDTSVERDGLTMRFRGWSYALEDYVGALELAGLVIEVLREPRPSPGTMRDTDWFEVPLFLTLRARKLAPPAVGPAS